MDRIAAGWEQFADKYAQDKAGEFQWAGDDFEETFESLSLPGAEGFPAVE